MCQVLVGLYSLHSVLACRLSPPTSLQSAKADILPDMKKEDALIL